MKNRVWRLCQGSVLILPFFPALGELGLVVVMIAVWRSHWKQITRNFFNYYWLAFATWLIINSTLAYQPIEAWLGLANWLPFICLAIALSYVINSIERLICLAWLLVIPAILTVALGLGQLYLKWNSPAIVSNILGWELVAGGIPEGRMSSIFIYANFLAIYLVFTFVLSLGLCLYYWEESDRIAILILSLSLVFNSIGLLLANSRNSWLIAGLSCFCFALYRGWYWLVSLFTAAIAVICGASFGSFSGQVHLRKIVPEFIWSRLSDREFSDRPIETLRLTQWQFVWGKIQEKPFVGWGLRNYTPLYLERSGYWFGHPHNLFLMLGMEIGIVATVFLCCIVGLILARAVYYCFFAKRKSLDSSKRIIVFTYLVTMVSCTVFNFFDVTLFDLRVNTISWIILAAIWGISRQATTLEINPKL